MVDRMEIEKKIEKLTQFINHNIVNPNIPNAYYNRGLAYYNLGENKKAIEDFSYFIENSKDNADGYLPRGIAYHKLGEYKKAIEDFSYIITNNDNNDSKADAYLSRGVVYYDQKEYQKAIEDINKAIKEYKKTNTINPIVYYNRGLIYNKLKKNQKAIEDFSYYINNKYNNDCNADAYLSRGVVYSEQEKFQKAVADFNDCIKINPNFIKAHLNLGRIYYILGKYKESADSYNNAKKDPLFVLSELYKREKNERRIKIRNVISEMIDLDETNFFNRTTISLNQTKQRASKNIYIIMLELISILHINNKNESTFSHYTKRSTASQLIFKSSPFRLNSTITCNDPEEGKTLLKYLGKDEIDNPKKEHNYQAFIGCFTFNRESLNQFRLYGKEDNKEATGVSLEIKKEFFDEEVGVTILGQIYQPDTSQFFESESNFVEKTDKEENNKKDKEENKKYALYRCIYLDPEIKRAISVGHIEEYAFYREKNNCLLETINKYKNYKEDIDEVIEDVNLKLKELCEHIEIAKGENNENLPIICELLLPLRYLVKHVAFKEEQECRIFDVKDLKEDKNDKEVHFTDDFMQMYIEYQPITKEELAGVVFAPKAEKIEVFNESLRQNDFNITCERSTLPFS